jgi:hypothetical protein
VILGAGSLELGAWSWELGAGSLELGAWGLELGAWGLELGGKSRFWVLGYRYVKLLLLHYKTTQTGRSRPATRHPPPSSLLLAPSSQLNQKSIHRKTFSSKNKLIYQILSVIILFTIYSQTILLANIRSQNGQLQDRPDQNIPGNWSEDI